MTLESHLPEFLKDARIDKLSGGLSGAGVYLVEKDGTKYVLKFSDTAALMREVGDAGVAPRVIHSDAETVLCEFVENKMFFGLLMADPKRAIDALGSMLGKVHALPIPRQLQGRNKRWFLESLTTQHGDWPRPAWFREGVAEVLAMPEPDPGPDVLSHNDVNPTNLVWDGARLLLLDWDVASAGSRYYDLAAVALFFRFDTAMCLRLISAHDGVEVSELPARFIYDRRLVGAMIGTIFLKLAREGGHSGDADAQAIPLGDAFMRMREGKLDPGTPDGQFVLGLALIAHSRLPLG
ncbi:MAG: phosphotransferase [Kofleriaceae bacterium]